MKFVITSMDADTDQALYQINISVDLIDETQGSKVLATFSIGLAVDSTLPGNTIKAFILQETVTQVQAKYNAWKLKQAAVTNFLLSNQASLETYLNSHVTL